jgi:ZIP family zinc transporter
MDLSRVLFAFALTLFAGLSTGIGSLLSLLTKRTNTKFLSISLGFSAGVMIYVSFVEIFVKAKDSLVSALGYKAGMWATVGGFFFGILIIAVIDKLIPSVENPHEVHVVEEMDGESESHKSNLMRMGVFTALAIAIHNFPEGIAVAVPIYYATGSKKKAFKLSFLSGLSEPIGALVGYILLYRFFNDAMFGFIFASVAGIMVYISLDELLPSAREYGEHHLSIYGLIAGMAVMALSLLMFI